MFLFFGFVLYSVLLFGLGHCMGYVTGRKRSKNETKDASVNDTPDLDLF